jgi:hypothetical protein
MSAIPIQSEFDLKSARNMLRKKMVGGKWLPPFQARAATTLTLMGELILLSEKPGTVQISILTKQGVWGVELKCNFIDNGELFTEDKHQRLEHIVDSLQTSPKDGRLYLITQLWLS